MKPRILEEEFSVGDTVGVARTRHGWYNGEQGSVVRFEPGSVIVLLDSGYEVEIEHCRDLYKY